MIRALLSAFTSNPLRGFRTWPWRQNALAVLIACVAFVVGASLLQPIVRPVVIIVLR